MHSRLGSWLILTCCLGCGGWFGTRQPAQVQPLPNPLEIRVSDHEFLWNELVDIVDDYFPIAREERVRLIGNVMTEGRIETQSRTGATAFEYFRRDTTPGFEKWHGTFQSVRRQAEVIVVPSQGGFGVSVVVRKELEDVDRPEMSSVGSAVQRHDGSLIRPQGSQVGGAISLGWIPVGRDISLEQKILTEIHRRFNVVETPPPIQTLHHTP